MGKPEQQDIVLRPKELVVGLSQAIFGFLSGKPESIAEGTATLLKAATTNDPAMQRAWELVSNSLSNSLQKILSSHREQLNIDPQRLGSFVASNVLDEAAPAKLPANVLSSKSIKQFYEQLAPVLHRWLETIEVPPNDAHNIVERTGGTLPSAIIEEWSRRPAHYAVASAALFGPFAEANQKQTVRLQYRAYLKALPDGAVFDETFSLRQIYVPLRCTWAVDPDEGEAPKTEDVDYAPRPRHEVGWLAEEVEKWLNDDSHGSHLCFVSGGPGSGKSSFAQTFASDQAFSVRNVVFIPLHQINTVQSLEASINEYFEASELLPRTTLNDLLEGSETLIIFDGLDELQSQGKAAQDTAQAFVGDLMRLLQVRNAKSRSLLALVTGRDLSIQGAEGVARSSAFTLHVAPYAFPERYPFDVRGPDSLTKLDQRPEWWIKYGQLSGSSIKALPSSLKSGELGDVTIQPLLNYLVALALRQGLQLATKTNINSVYAYLLEAVYERGWSKNPHPALQGMTADDFKRLLEEVAVSVWHGAGRTTSLREVEDHCRQSNIGKLVEKLEPGASTGVSRLLLAFYFRQHGTRGDGDKTFEFTHKSFAEYLISLRIVRLIDQVSKRSIEHATDVDAGWDLQTCFSKWIDVLGPAAMDEYVLAFVRREVDSRSVKEVEKWVATLTFMLRNCLMSRLPMHLSGSKPYKLLAVEERNASEALLVCVNACARRTKKVVHLGDIPTTAVGNFIRRTQGQRRGPRNGPLLRSLSFFDFRGQCFDILDLYNADLSYCDLRTAELNFANLCRAELNHADLRGAFLYGTLLDDAKVNEAKFSRKSLQASAVVHALPEPSRRPGEGLMDELRSRGAVIPASTVRRPKRESDT